MPLKKIKRAFALLIFIAICLFVGWLGGAATESSRVTWYAGLHKPALNPPDWVFAPVWTTLYIFMAVAGWRLWGLNLSNGSRVRLLFAAQLILNGLWSFLFFGLRSPIAGLIDIAMLWSCLLLLVRMSWPADRVSGFLLTPYLLWVSFAAYLNAALWWLN